MKKFTIQFLTIAAAVIVFSATNSFAQKRINLDSNGKAKISSTVEPNLKMAWLISGKDFNNLSITQTKGGKLRYEIKRGSQFLSSGHTTGSNIRVTSDSKSAYTFTIINQSGKAENVVFSVVN